MQPVSYQEGGPLMWMMPLHMHVNQKSDDEDDDHINLFKCASVLKRTQSKKNRINRRNQGLFKAFE